MANSNIIFVIVLFCFIVTPLIVCIVGNFKNKITIFDSYNDLILTFVIVVFPFLYYYTFFFMFHNKVVNILFLIIESALLFILWKTTYYCNHKNFFLTVCALYTKLFLSFLFFFYLLQIANSANKKNSNNSSKLTDFLMTIIVLPTITSFVRNRNNINMIRKVEDEI